MYLIFIPILKEIKKTKRIKEVNKIIRKTRRQKKEEKKRIYRRETKFKTPLYDSVFVTNTKTPAQYN